MSFVVNTTEVCKCFFRTGVGYNELPMKKQDVLQFLSEETPGILYFGGARMALLDINAGFWGIRRQMEALIGSRLTNSVLQQAGANGGVSFAESFGKAKDVEEQGRFFESCLQAYQTAGFGKFEIIEAHWPIGKVVIHAQETFEAWMNREHGQQADGPVCAYTAGVLVGFVNVISDRRDVVCIEHRCQALGDDVCEFELLPVSKSHNRPVVAFAPDPALGRQLNLLETLFERMPMGIAMFDREYHIQRYNTTWGDFSARYAPPSAAPLIPGVYYFDHLPGSESVAIPLFERVLAGETIRQNALRFVSGGISSYWDVVLSPLIEKGEVTGILNVTIDATERVMLQQNLEQRVNERTLELRTLLDVATAANSSLDLDETLITTLDLLIDLIGASRAGVMLRDETSGKLEARMLRPEQVVTPDVLAQIMQACETVVASGESLYVMPDAERGFAEPGALLPLRVRDRILGVLVIIGSEGERFAPEQLALFKSITDQMGVAVENARLYAQAEQVAIATERGRLARDLHDAVTQTLFSASLIAEVLPKLWERNPNAGKQKLEELRQLTRGALSEMRTMLMELRPSALAEADMSELFRHLVNAFVGRSRLEVRFEAQGEEAPPVEVKEVFYRVAQEALNNIDKHAGAKEVLIRLKRNDGSVELFVRDDGCGFNLEAASAEHLGLGIMQERARSIGALLKIQSAPGEGTELIMYWKDREERNDK